MHLDKHRPYGHVVGMPGVVWAQDGHFFDGSGRVVADPEAPQEPPHPDLPGSGEPDVVSLSASSSVSKDDMRLKENKAVKFQWEAFHGDEPFPGVAEAKRQLGMTE